MEDDGDTVADGHQDKVVTSASPAIDNLITRAKDLQAELETFRSHLRTLRQETSVELSHFRGTVKSELQMLERLSQKPDDEAAKHIARSSNLPFLETVWGTAKKSDQVVALQKRVYYDESCDRISTLSRGMGAVGLVSGRVKQKGGHSAGVVVDLIADGGRTWTKISLITNKRLIFDLAKQGWEGGYSSEDDEGFADDQDNNGDHDVPLVKTIKELLKAAASVRIRTKTPSVNLILPRVIAGDTPEVDSVLDKCRAAGATVYCGEDLCPVPQLEEALDTMASNPMTEFTDILNIDCTILLALVSEFSHAKVSKEPWFHKALKRQVEIEGNENLLPSLLYPAMAGHQLTCTEEAASRMREIVDTIGTPSEKARTAILMGDDKDKTQSQLIEDMQSWSAYEVPAEWQLPIKVVNQNENDCQASLPTEAVEASRDMTDINRSVFLSGWATGRTIITSNRTVVKQIEHDLEKHDDLDDSVWPKIWLCPTARSLVGKEKRGAKKEGNEKFQAWLMPDSLVREQQRRNGLDVLSLKEGYEVEDLRPNGYDYQDVIEAKNASER